MYKKARPWLRFIEGTEGGQAGGGEPNGTPDTQDSTTNPDATNTDAGDSQEGETDWKSKAEEWKRYARTWETRAKENQDKAKRLDELDDQSKTELEKATERAAQLEEKIPELERRALRAEIASEYGITGEDRDLYLTATDEETLRKQAEGLASRQRQGEENPLQGRGGSGPNRQSAEAWAKTLLGKKQSN